MTTISNGLSTMRTKALLPTLGLMLFAAWGCDGNPLAKGGAEETEPAAAQTGEAGPCADYAEKLCGEAGAESPTCEAVRTTTALMPAAACKAGISDMAFTKSKLAEKTKTCTELVEKLCADVGPTTATCEMVRGQTKQFPPERCEMMMGHYDEVLADLKKMEARNQPLSEEKQALIAAGDAPSFGPKDAKVTIVEFSDFECPYCSRAADVATKVKEKYGDQVRFIFRQFPLSFHANAHGAAQASLAANAQGKFWEFHDRLFAQQKQLDRPALEALAKDVGLNVAEFKKALDAKTHAPAVDAELEMGKEVGVDGTPSMFINGARIPNPTDFEMVSKLIDETLKKNS